jgi:hypothetical protein
MLGGAFQLTPLEKRPVRLESVRQFASMNPHITLAWVRPHPMQQQELLKRVSKTAS